MPDILIVFLGGGLGSISRYLISQLVYAQFNTNFPLGTFTVNILGCFFIGVIMALNEKYQLDNTWVLLLSTGFCGGFTTFSTFSYENNLLLRSGDYLGLMAYTILSLLWGFAGTILGLFIIKKF